MTISRDTAEAAAAWWAERLRNPKFDNLGPSRGQNAEETRVNEFASMLASMNVADDGVTDAQLESFREYMAGWLTGRESEYLTLGVDYGPDATLSDIAEATGIPARRFPWKTVMWIKPDGSVDVSYGYRGNIETIHS